MAECVLESDGSHSTPASCLQVNVNRPVRRRLEESELRLEHIGCLIEMH